MNFDFSSDVLSMTAELRRVLDRVCPMPELRRCLHEGVSSQATWKALADLGVLGAAVPEAEGGSGMSLLELAACAEEIGRACAPVPMLGSVYLATEAVLRGGTPAQRQRWLPALAAGQLSACAAWQTRTFQRDGDRLTATLEQAIGSAEAALAVVVLDDAAWLVDLAQPGVRRRALPVLDPGLQLTRIELDRVHIEPLACDTQALKWRAMACLAFEQLGGAERALEMARSYALQRRTFGRTVASYQAIKHKLADVWVKNQIARGHAYRAAWAMSAAERELPLSALAARVACSEAFEHAAQENLQVHGGIGFTWEADCHPLYKRARSTALVLGPTIDCKQQLAALLGAPDAPVETPDGLR